MGNAASHPLHVQGEGALLMLLDTQHKTGATTSSSTGNVNDSCCSSPLPVSVPPTTIITTCPHQSAVSPSLTHTKPSFPVLLPFSTPSCLSALYTLAEKIGDGDSATVRRCTSVATGAEFACKSIHKQLLRTEQDRDRVRTEVSIMWKLSGSSPDLDDIVKLQDVIEDANNVHIVTELCRGGSLLDRRQKARNVSQENVARIMKSLLKALQACHNRGIVHGAVKPANILFLDDSDDSPVKLANFGSAFSIHDKVERTMKTQQEIHTFMAPETLKGEEEGGSICYGKEVDAWGVGMLLYLLLSGGLPFNGYDEQSVKRAIMGEKISYEGRAWNFVPASAKRLVRRLLCRDVKLRMSVEQALEHEWILGESSTSPCSTRSSSYSCRVRSGGGGLRPSAAAAYPI